MKIDKKQLRKFRETFQKENKVKLSDEEAGDALENLVNFFDLLIQFDQKKRVKR